MKNEKKLGCIKLYNDKNVLTFKSNLLHDYNSENKNKSKKRKLKKDDYKNLENLYTSIQAMENNKNGYIDLYWKKVYKFKNNINDKKYIQNQWLKMTLNEKVDYEKVISYFINNITTWKITNKRINKKYIDLLLTKIKTIDNIENLENTIDNCNIWEYINNKYIYEKLNTNWQLEKLYEIIKEKEDIQEKYKQLTKKEKENEKENYEKLRDKIQHKEKRLKENIKKQYLYLIEN